MVRDGWDAVCKRFRHGSALELIDDHPLVDFRKFCQKLSAHLYCGLLYGHGSHAARIPLVHALPPGVSVLIKEAAIRQRLLQQASSTPFYIPIELFP